MSLAPGACAGISAESEAGSPLGGPSAPKRGTFQADWRFTTPPARRVKSEIQSAGYARRRRLFTRLRTRVQFPPSPPPEKPLARAASPRSRRLTLLPIG